MWHLSALAEIYGLSLDEIADSNRSKLNDLSNVDNLPATPLHDDAPEVPENERLPRQLTVSFISVGPGRLQMFHEGLPLGDELTDNSIEEDGYRFHDSLHLANAAKLGWSPVLRALTKTKRRYSDVVDNSQDGARARIVEELIIKAIHSEGERAGGSSDVPRSDVLFTSREQIPFSLLRLIRRFAKGLEVEKNRLWEWQDAILEGHRIYTALRREGQGTVCIDLDRRSVSFCPEVCANVVGPVVGMGMAVQKLAVVDRSGFTQLELAAEGTDDRKLSILAARKKAILESLSLDAGDRALWIQLRVSDVAGVGISVKASGPVLQSVWDLGIASFASSEMILENEVVCSITAMGCPPSR